MKCCSWPPSQHVQSSIDEICSMRHATACTHVRTSMPLHARTSATRASAAFACSVFQASTRRLLELCRPVSTGKLSPQSLPGNCCAWSLVLISTSCAAAPSRTAHTAGRSAPDVAARLACYSCASSAVTSSAARLSLVTASLVEVLAASRAVACAVACTWHSLQVKGEKLALQLALPVTGVPVDWAPLA
jgi:hypothetical protein